MSISLYKYIYALNIYLSDKYEVYYITSYFTTVIVIAIVIFSKKNKTHYFHGEIAKTPAQLRKGLMFQHPLKRDEGMLFHFKTKNNTLWMKNTYIPLDMIFLSEDFKVIGYIQDVEHLTLTSRSINKPSTYVLEMNGNSVSVHNISIGDTISFIEKI